MAELPLLMFYLHNEEKHLCWRQKDWVERGYEVAKLRRINDKYNNNNHNRITNTPFHMIPTLCPKGL